MMDTYKRGCILSRSSWESNIAHSVTVPKASDLRAEVFSPLRSMYLVQQSQSCPLVNHVRPPKKSIELSSLSQESKN